MKHALSITFILLSVLFVSCGSQGPKHKNEIGSIVTRPASEPALPKVWFTFAPATLKCENLLKFMEYYRSSVLPSMNLAADWLCKGNEEKISRSFIFIASNGDRETIQLTIDTTGQVSNADGIALGSFTFMSAKNPLFDESALASYFDKWVRDNAPTPRQECESLSKRNAKCPFSKI
ncbi:MAG: hypothetical protein H7249_19170 [Chitinophagaceae bacterium]|nr:hypothetical protein [Oligoflexus sp.]